MQTRLDIPTQGPGLYDITGAVAQQVAGEGLCTVFVRHTSCSLLVQENADPDVPRDLLAWLDRLVPPADHPAMAYLRHTAEGPDDMPAHIKAALLPVSLQIPFSGGRLGLGTWQGIFLVEHRTRPHMRQVIVHIRRDT